MRGVRFMACLPAKRERAPSTNGSASWRRPHGCVRWVVPEPSRICVGRGRLAPSALLSHPCRRGRLKHHPL